MEAGSHQGGAHWPSGIPDGPPPGAWPRWPAWYGPVGLLVATVATLFLTVFVAGGLEIAGVDTEKDETVLTAVGTLAQAFVFVGTAVLFARMIAPPKPADFGLRRTRPWPAVGWAVLAFASFFAFAVAYGAVLGEEVDQSTLEDLGTDRSTLALLFGGFLVVVVAPITEEVFFRGFFYRALRSRFRPLAAALLVGGLFGLAHAFTGIEAVPPLAFLGVVFCLLYERTGSLFPLIGLHAFNNALAFGVADEGDGTVAAVLGLAVVAACFLVPLALARGHGRGEQPAPATTVGA